MGTRNTSRRASVEPLFQGFGAFGCVGELLGVDRVSPVEPRECFGVPAGRLEGVGVRIAEPDHPRLAAFGLEWRELECAERRVELPEVAPGA